MQHLSVLTAHGDAVACARERRHNPWRAEEGDNFIVLLIVILIVIILVVILIVILIVLLIVLLIVIPVTMGHTHEWHTCYACMTHSRTSWRWDTHTNGTLAMHDTPAYIMAIHAHEGCMAIKSKDTCMHRDNT